PPGSDNYVAGVAVANDYWVIGNTNSFGPSIGTEHILYSRYTGATGASAWDRKYYDGANPSISYTATDIQAGYGNLTASPSVSALPCSFTACPVFAPPVNAVAVPKSKNYFYVSGYYKDPAFGVRRPIMLKLGNNGNILWVRTNIFAGTIYDEIGISAESCPNGDMMMVSAVTNPVTGITFPAVTRVDINGVLLWRYFYSSPTFQPAANFIPHQSCVYREFLNGNINDPIGITITGERNIPGAIGSTHFVMRIRYDGMMLWKMEYPLVTPSGITPNSQGWDIMFEDETVGVAGIVDNFVITGLSNTMAVGATPGCLGFLQRVNVNTGAFVNAHRFGVPGTTAGAVPLTYGQSIYQARLVAQNVVIAGGVDDTNNGVFSDTYLLEMDITNGTIFNAHHYALTTPNFPRTESVVSVGGGYPTPGYFISTNSLNTYGGATLTDAHVIKTNGTGMVNPTTCHSDTLKPVFDTVKSNPVTYCTDQSCQNFIPHQLVMKKKTAQHVLCFSATKLTEEMETSLELGASEIGVFPNPVSNNQDIQLLFSTDNAGEYNIRVMDINGRIIKSMNQFFDEGDQQFAIETSSLSDGIYFISVSNGGKAFSTKFIKLK
ncbi:MAG TPA: T9SS type A sorting domain-containing protein, partial [Chitinophagales bacterium]|nr:T9SS type A sorting domain-containing protein [Chitinophagales bacterium]